MAEVLLCIYYLYYVYTLGDPPHYYYMTISGTALVINSRKSGEGDELIHTPVATIKRGKNRFFKQSL